MKTYKNLYEQLISEENVEIAIHNALKGKCKKKRKAKKYQELKNKDKSILIPEIIDYAKNFKHFEHIKVHIHDGVRQKERDIIVPSLKEEVLHHMLINVLKPIFMKPLYEHSYGSIPGRGAHTAKKFISRWIKNDVKNTKYVLKMDIRKYFDSIPHNILKDGLSKIIKDKRFLNILFEVIDITDVGIALGFYTSQWLANYYLTGLDHCIKQELGAVYYVRYVDDMVILGPNKKKLHKIKDLISTYLKENLGLDMKQNWQVFKLAYKNKEGKYRGRDLDFMGFRFYRDKVTLRKSILKKIMRRVHRMDKKRKSGKPWTIHDIRVFLSYYGWIKSTQTHDKYYKEIVPFISIKSLKKMVSSFDKKAKEVKKLCC